MWEENYGILHHDNASSHKANMGNEFLIKHSTTTIQPPYHRGCTTSNHHSHQIWLQPTFFHFPKLKLPLRGIRFHSVEYIKKKARTKLNSGFQDFDDWVIRWGIVYEGAYFKGFFWEGVKNR